MSDNREVLTSIDKLSKKLELMISKLDSSVRTTSANRSQASAKSTIKNMEDAGKKLAESTTSRAELLEELSKTDRKVLDSSTGKFKINKKYTEIIDKINSTMQSLDDGVKSQTEEIYNVIASSKSTRKDQMRYLDLYSRTVQDSATAVSQNIKKSSLLGSALLRSSSAIDEGSIEYHKLMENLYETSKPLGEHILRYANAWDESTKSVKANLSNADFAEINLKIGSAAASLADSLAGTGFSSIDELVSANEDELLRMFTGASDVASSAGKLKNAMISAALGLEQSGLNVNAGLMFDRDGQKRDGVNDIKLRELNQAGQTVDGNLTAEGKAAAEELIKIVKNLGEINAKASNAQNAFTQNSKLANSELGKMVLHYQDARKTSGAAVASLKTVPKTMGLIAVAGSQIADVVHKLAPGFNAVMDFNTAYVPIDFKTANIQAIKMGMSLEESTKYMQDNKNTMALYGEGFGTLQARMTRTANNFGLTMNQAASTVQPAIASAIASGVDVTNQDALFNSIDNTLKGFSKLSGVLNLTTEQYAQSNAELLTSHDVQASLLGLDSVQTQQTAKSLILQRDEYAVRLGSLQAAQDLIKLQAQQGREKIMERVKTGAFAMLAGQQAGMSQSESQRLFRISQKADSRRTAEERKFLTDSMGKINLSQQQQVASADTDFAALAIENFQEQVNDQLGTLGTIGAAQQEMFARAKANANVSDAQQSMASTAAAANTTVAEFGQTVDNVSAFFNNTFLKSLVSSSAALVGLAISAMSAAANLYNIGGGFGTGVGTDSSGKTDKKSPRTGKMGNLAKGGGALLKGSVVGIVGGLTLDYASDKLLESGHTRAGGIASAGSTALTGAGMGAMTGAAIGAAFGGVGAVPGALIGGALGTAYGVYDNWDNIMYGGDSKPSDNSMPYSSNDTKLKPKDSPDITATLALSAGTAIVSALNAPLGQMIKGLNLASQLNERTNEVTADSPKVRETQPPAANINVQQPTEKKYLIADKLMNAALAAIPGFAILNGVKSLVSPTTKDAISINPTMRESANTTITSDVNTSTAPSTKNAKNSDRTEEADISQVADIEARQHLTALLESVQKTVVLLQQIANNTVPETSTMQKAPTVPPSILPAAAYYQGRS